MNDVYSVNRHSDALQAARIVAAERAFGALAIGLHISGRLCSPGLLDMIRETMTSGRANQIEHSEHLPSERVFYRPHRARSG